MAAAIVILATLTRYTFGLGSPIYKRNDFGDCRSDSKSNQDQEAVDPEYQKPFQGVTRSFLTLRRVFGSSTGLTDRGKHESAAFFTSVTPGRRSVSSVLLRGGVAKKAFNFGD